jgi:hypothetical protein
VARVGPSGSKTALAWYAFSKLAQPSTAPPTLSREKSPGSPTNFGVSEAEATTCRTLPRSSRSIRSSGVSSMVAGMITAPSLMPASISSHNAT